MLNNIILFSLKNKLFVFLAVILLVAGGLYKSYEMDVDVFPDLTAPTVVVMSDAHGMASEEVERLVTFPIETAVNGATDVRRVRSASLHGFSFIWVEFDWGTDIFKARQIVSEKMVTLGSLLPDDVIPMLAPQSSVMGEILLIGLQADSTSQMELRAIADWVIKPAVLGTGGVSQVSIMGGDYKQYKILANPVKMKMYGVTMSEIAETGKTASLNSSGGVLRDFGNEYLIRGIARTHDLQELGATFIKTVNDRPVVLSDVANIIIGSAKKMGDASLNAKPAVILAISKQPNVNTLDVTETIERNLIELKKTLPADVIMDTRIFRQADFIEASVSNVGKALLEGALFVVIILFLFLGSLRTTLISILAIPLSLLGTVIVLDLLEMNINTMTLGGMCIAIGSLVDDAIIDVENVFKRLRQNYQKAPEERDNVLNVVYEGSKEIRASILNATLIIIVAFTPLFFLTGMEGRMLKPLGVAYIVSLFMSLIVAMTVTPLLCKLLLSKDQYLNRKKNENWLSRKISEHYLISLKFVFANKKKVLFSTLAVFLISLFMFFNMGQSFLPEFNEGSLVISAVTKPGVSLDVSSQLGNLIEEELLKIPEVTSTARRTGRGELDEHAQPVNSAELDINFNLKDRSREEFMADVRYTLSSIPGIATTVGQPLGHRIDHMLSGTRANIAIKVFGSDLSQLYLTANQISEAISDVGGLVDVTVDQQTETPQLQIRADRGMLAKYAITMDDFNKFVEMAFAGEKIADIYEGQRKFDLVLLLNDDYTATIDQLKSSLIDTGFGTKVPLEEIAEIVSTGGPGTISRENVQRKIVVSANVAGRDMEGVVNDIKRNIDEQVQFPEGYRVEFGGQFESAQRASRILLIASIIAVVVIFLLLFVEFKNFSLAGVVLLNLPLALIGGVFAVFFASGIISIPSIIGFITLFGIATRNGILLMTKYQQLRNNKLSVNDIIMTGSRDRLSPVLMTALTAALALIPLVMAGDKPGNEIQSPMAVVVLGGLITSTFLNMYIVPIVYAYLISRKGNNESSFN